MISGSAFHDRDFIRTPEDMFLCVVGELHPHDRVISYLRYLPSSNGLWKQGDQKYRRAMASYSIPNLLMNIDYLKKNYPTYVFNSEVFGVEMSSIPITHVVEHYKPQAKLSRIFKMANPDALQTCSRDLVNYLSESTKIPIEEFGVTGSILIDLHNPKFSDVDLTISGRENGFKLKRSLPELSMEKDGPISSIPEKALNRWYQEKLSSHPLNVEELNIIQRRQWNYRSFNGTVFSLHTVRSKNDLHEHYGDLRYTSVGIVEGRALISDVSDSLFNPHVYKVEMFKVDVGPALEEINVVASYSGFYGGIFEEGEEVSVRGKLERVDDTLTCDMYHRVVVGSPEAGDTDYIKPLIENNRNLH